MHKLSRVNGRSVVLIGSLFLGISVIIALTDRAPLYPIPKDTPYTLESIFNQWVQETVLQTRPGPFAYRVLVPYTVYFVERITSIPGLTVDFCLKVLFLTFLQHFGSFVCRGLFSPFYIGIYYVVGLILELRLWTALLVVVIPLAVGSLVRAVGSMTATASEFSGQTWRDSQKF